MEIKTEITMERTVTGSWTERRKVRSPFSIETLRSMCAEREGCNEDEVSEEMLADFVASLDTYSVWMGQRVLDIEWEVDEDHETTGWGDWNLSVEEQGVKR